jgi:hypothetical protein
MKVTRNKEPNRVCHLCGKPLVVGEPGANYLPTYTVVHRGHPACVNQWRRRQQLRDRNP